MRRFASVLVLGVLGSAAAIPLACGGGGSSDTQTGLTTSATGAGGETTGAGGSSSGGGLFGNGGSGPALKLTIKPPSATIDVQNGVSTPVMFQAFVGAGMVNPSTWVVDLSSIATVDGSGNVTATNKQGGAVTLTAKLNGQIATAVVTVNMHQLINPGGVSGPDQATLAAAANPDAGITWAYPYDKTVFPKGLLAPPMMWNGGAATDEYEIHFVGKYVDFQVFTLAAPPSSFTLDDASWTALTESGQGGPVNVTVARLPAGAQSANLAINHTWTIANGSLRGTVYYWSNNQGSVLRIKPGAVAPENFLAAGNAPAGCTTCHAVSANGSTLMIGGDAPVSTWNLLTNAAAFNVQTVGKAIRNWAMPAISPNAKFLVENNAPLPGPPGGSDGMWDPMTGTKVMGTGLDGVLLDMPSFGPSGSKLAYVDHAAHNLGVYDFDESTGMVTNATKLVDLGADPSQTIAFPSISPDAKWVVYHRGSLDTRFGPGDLFLASVDQPGVEQRLSGIDGDSYPFAAGARDLHYNYEPTFAPLNSGGYAWVVFTSRRTYGNQLTGPAYTGNAYTGPQDGTKQLWVAAIDQTPVPGADPSHPAFRVPGQDQNWNMRGFWALDPCKQIGGMCGTGSECCNQNCVEGVCKDPMPNMCASDGNACKMDGDCCTKQSKCINGFCSSPPPN